MLNSFTFSPIAKQRKYLNLVLVTDVYLVIGGMNCDTRGKTEFSIGSPLAHKGAIEIKDLHSMIA